MKGRKVVKKRSRIRSIVRWTFFVLVFFLVGVSCVLLTGRLVGYGREYHITCYAADGTVIYEHVVWTDSIRLYELDTRRVVLVPDTCVWISQ